jgi:(p)ppGpp synthase/HD superfamily hydrolase
MPDTPVSRKVLRVSLADKLHNVRSILLDRHQVGEAIWERFNGGKDGSIWYYESLLGTYERKLGETALVEEFRAAVSRLTR